MAFQSISTGTYTVHPSANDVASTSGDGSYLKETLVTDLLDAIAGQGDWVLSGFDYSSASGLTATFNAGSAVIGGYYLTRTGTFDVTLTDEATNHVWLTFSVDGSNNVSAWGVEVNTTGTAPTSVPGYVKLDELVTTGGAVSGNTDQRTTTHPLEESDATNITAGTLKHERGGLEADVSAYDGFVKISGGATSAVTAPSGTVVGTTDTQTLTNKTIGAATLSGTLSVADNIVDQPILQDYAIQGSAIGNVGATQTFDCETANYFTATLDQACTFTFSNPPASGDAGGFRMVLTNGAAFTITWPASVDWAGGSAPTLTAAGVDILDFSTSDGGTTWYGVLVGADMG